MIRNWMEELFDTLCYLGVVVGLIFFFVLYWRDSYQLRCAEAVLDEFLNNVAAEGKVSVEQYEGVIHQLVRINSDYDLEIACTSYVLQPCYAQIPEEELDSYYMRRNVRKEYLFSEYEWKVQEEDAEQMCLQTDTNATILAEDKNAYLPLPNEERIVEVEAVRAYQELYEGENLITLCRVISDAGSCYVEAETVCAHTSGVLYMKAVVGGELYSVPVEVICHPRIVSCSNGHKVVNSKEILEEWKRTDVIPCPYCKVIPDTIQCSTPVLERKNGTFLAETELWLEVTFMDGHKEQIGPETEGWEDNYDENYCGIQNVIVRYRGAETSVTIVSENEGCEKCNGECNERCYSDYIAFPYCTKCMSEVLLFSGEVYEEARETVDNELLARLDEQKEVYLELGDFITVRLLKNGEYQTFLQSRVNRNRKSR